MKRTSSSFKQADALIMGDAHLREDAPICRTDDFEKTQWRKMDFIKELSEIHECPVLCPGDLFDHWKPSPWLLSKTIEHLPKRFYTVYGNHDLPDHSMDFAYKSGVSTLLEAGKLYIEGCCWGEKVEDVVLPILDDQKLYGNCVIDAHVLLWHVMTYDKEPPFPSCEDSPAIRLLRKYPQFQLIVTGHNHTPFVVKYKDRLLVNPGSVTRQSVDETHLPRVYLWYAGTNEVTPVFLPLEKNVISRDHLESKQGENARLTAYIEKLNTNYEISIDFEKNLKRFIEKNKVRKPIADILLRSISKDENK